MELCLSVCLSASVTEKLAEPDVGDWRSAWREYHGNVTAWNDDRGSTMWKYESTSTTARTSTSRAIQDLRRTASSAAVVDCCSGS